MNIKGIKSWIWEPID